MSSWKTYAERDRVLAEMGYGSYAEYLASPLWAGIRGRTIGKAKGVCGACGRRTATQVHHRSYARAVLLGEDLTPLVACCAGCHRSAEFAGGKKVSPATANKRLEDAAASSGVRPKPAACTVCLKNPAPRQGKPVCKRCRREGPAVGRLGLGMYGARGRCATCYRFAAKSRTQCRLCAPRDGDPVTNRYTVLFSVGGVNAEEGCHADTPGEAATTVLGRWPGAVLRYVRTKAENVPTPAKRLVKKCRRSKPKKKGAKRCRREGRSVPGVVRREG